MDSFYVQTYILVIGIICSITSSRAVCPSDRNKPWCYDDSLPNGPSNWYRTYCNCSGQMQSPINIITSQVLQDPRNLVVTNYDKPIRQVKIENNGYRINMYPMDGVQRTLTFNGSIYMLTSVHFHFGSSSNAGSEHAINGRKYTIECHLEHKSQDGRLLTLSSFMQQGQINYSIDVMLVVRGSYTYEGEYFQGQVSKSDSNNPGRTMIYLDDLVQVGGAYYRYAGSIEFPPCNETKYWLVMKPNKQISSSQLQQLYSLYRAQRGANNLEQCHLINNFRPIQPTNGRPVYG
ncbi:carbonic anhydrase 7 [Parasteatoda tepidariorum]|uniref:carbonic anhydrase 7 n=1 Tax=Parasteatoda tepidariorum TaxID=114398 RepID=UPI001C727AB7|nr:carbonic anhydrase 7 [Parasteatoda tepidariorum]